MRLKKAEREMIGSARVCRVATAGGSGVPHCMPVCPVFDGKKIYFGSANRGKKISHLKQNPHIALVFDDYTEAWSGLRGITVFGEVKLIARGPLFRKIRRLLYKKYPQYEIEAPIEEEESVIAEVTLQGSFSWGL